MGKFKLNVSNDADYLTHGLGITDERHKEISNRMTEVLEKEDGATLTEVFKGLAEIAQNAEELAFIFFKFGEEMGGLKVIQEVLEQELMGGLE